MSLRSRLFIGWALLALLLWVGMYWVVEAAITSSFDRRAQDSFTRTREALQSHQQHSNARMRQACSLLMQIPELRALIAEHSYELHSGFSTSLEERLDHLAEVVDAHFAVALNADAFLIASGGAFPWADAASFNDYLHGADPARHMIKHVFDLMPERRADPNRGISGLWTHEGRIYQVVAVPLSFQQGSAERRAPIEGALVVGSPMTDQFASELGQAQDCEVSFMVGGVIAASSVVGSRRNELIDLLHQHAAYSAVPVVLPFAGEQYLTLYEPLMDPVSGTAVGGMAIQRSLRDSAQLLGDLSRRLLMAMGAGLLLAAIGSLLLGAAITRPIDQLVGVVRRVGEGDLDQRLPDSRRDELGELARAFNDMISQVREREQLQRRVIQMETATRTKSDFLASMSHEIRTPMTAILGYAELLRNPKQLDDDRLNAVDVIRRNGNHLLAIINDILDLSKIEAGEMKIERIACSPCGVLSDVLSLMRIRATEKGLTFKVEITGAIPQTIHTDPTRLRQILINLVGNAIKFTESGSVRLLAGLTHASETETQQLRLQVIDTGMGMTREQLEHIFEPFSQADESTTRRFGGSGLGLSICRQLAAMLGGRIEAHSTHGAGSVFIVTIDPGPIEGVPMLTDFEEAISDHQAEHRTAVEAPKLQGRLLLAEDGDDNRNLLAFYLRSAGAEVTTVENGRLAYESAGKANPPFDLILMDMQMPEMDGYTATRQLRKEGYTAPIVALTANAMAEDEAKCYRAGCTGYLTKPLSRDALISGAARYLQDAPAAAPQEPEPDGSLTPDAGVITSEAIDESAVPFLEAYIKALPRRVNALLTLLEQRDRAGLTQQLHMLKGSGGLYGLMPISHQAGIAEAAAASEQDLDDVARQVHELVQLLRRVEGYDPAEEAVDAAAGATSADMPAKPSSRQSAGGDGVR